MTDEQFKMELTLASYVEKEKARGILVDVSRIRHKMAPEVQLWRVKNISSRYNGAATRAFTDLKSAVDWLTAGQVQRSAAD